MDYKYTMDQVYKLQRPFRLDKDDLFMVSHGGTTKVAKISDLIYECYKSVLEILLEKNIVTKDQLNNLVTKEEFLQHINKNED